jgi:hypothetical protein
VGFIDEIARGETTNLEEFQRRRASLINVLEQLELEVKTILNGLGASYEPPAPVRAKIAELFREKDGLVRAILDLDLQILGHIDRIKSETIRKLQSLQVGRRSVGAYKSPMDAVEAAEGTKIVDQEA